MTANGPVGREPDHEFTVVSTDSGDWWCLLEISGELDLAARPRLLEAVDDAFERGRRHVAVDASGLTFIDSGGLVGLMNARKKMLAAGGSLRLTAASTQVERVIAIAGMADDLLDERG